MEYVYRCFESLAGTSEDKCTTVGSDAEIETIRDCNTTNTSNERGLVVVDRGKRLAHDIDYIIDILEDQKGYINVVKGSTFVYIKSLMILRNYLYNGDWDSAYDMFTDGTITTARMRTFFKLSDDRDKSRTRAIRCIECLTISMLRIIRLNVEYMYVEKIT